MPKPKAVWVSRDPYDGSGYEFWTTEPVRKNEYFHAPDGVKKTTFIAELTADQLASITDYHLQPGECRRVVFSVEEL